MGSANFITWKVQGYDVYILEGGNLNKLADLNASTLNYTQTGLNPITNYTYRVAVNYYITGDDLNYDTKCYTEVKASTLTLDASPTQTTSPMPPVTAGNTSQFQTQGMPVWLIAAMGLTGTAALATIASVLIKRGNKPRDNQK